MRVKSITPTRAIPLREDDAAFGVAQWAGLVVEYDTGTSTFKLPLHLALHVLTDAYIKSATARITDVESGELLIEVAGRAMVGDEALVDHFKGFLQLYLRLLTSHYDILQAEARYEAQPQVANAADSPLVTPVGEEAREGHPHEARNEERIEERHSNGGISVRDDATPRGRRGRR